MSLDLFTVEKGMRMLEENGDTGVDQLFGAGAPGTLAEHDDAAVGSIYQQTDGSGHIYRKKEAGAGTARWVRAADEDDILSINFRSELVRAATGDVAPLEGGTIDLGTTPFGDDDAPTLTGADFAVGEHIIFGVGGTPVLGQVSNIATDVLTITYLGFPALSDGDKFVVRNFIPDSPDDQEAQALVLYNGSAIIKLGDVNFAFATGIGLSSGFTPANGTITSADTVESAIEKIVDNQADLQTFSGVSQGSTDLGTFPGAIIADNETVKGALEDLEGFIEGLSVIVQSEVQAVTAATTIDTMLVDNVLSAQWLVRVSLDSAPERVKSFVVHAHHNGSGAADATAVDRAVYARLRNGLPFPVIINVDVSGAGTAQEFRLRVSAPAAVTVNVARLAVVDQ